MTLHGYVAGFSTSLDLGVNGFRVDAISHLVEHKDFPDNPQPRDKLEEVHNEPEQGQDYYTAAEDDQRPVVSIEKVHLKMK